MKADHFVVDFDGTDSIEFLQHLNIERRFQDRRLSSVSPDGHPQHTVMLPQAMLGIGLIGIGKHRNR